MFSGIVEFTSRVLEATSRGAVVQLIVEKPSEFNDLSTGDSIATDGICLTLEEQTSTTMRFALGPETLKVTGWDTAGVLNRVVNLERSLRMGDRIHGHLVTGHVDSQGTIVDIERQEGSQVMKIAFPDTIRPFIWPKGSITVNGVSLTINQVTTQNFSVGLIPETLKRTNLGLLSKGQSVNLEVDNNARGLVHWLRQQEPLRSPK